MSGPGGLRSPNRMPNRATTSGGWEIRKLWTCVLAATSLFALGTATTAMGASGGNNNAGDVWTDNVGQPAGPGHEQDPHLACQDINLWGSGLADASGSYTIDGWPPSGSQERDYASSWSYNQSQGGSQVISVISVKTLIETAVAHGDAPVNGQGYHFKLQFSQDPQKHKTFWVNCPAPKSGGGEGGEGPKEERPKEERPNGEGTKGGGDESGGAPKGEGPKSGSGEGVSGSSLSTAAGGQTPSGPVKSTRKSHSNHPRHQKSHGHHHNLVRPKRHLKAHRRNGNGASDAAPKFTG